MVGCLCSALYDVILDLRQDSPAFGQSIGSELSAENRIVMYVPQGGAHSSAALGEGTEAFYLVNAFYGPD